MFQRTVCTVNRETGRYELTESNETETGLLQDKPLTLLAGDRGKTKDVCGVS